MNKLFKLIQLSRLEKQIFFQALLLLPLAALAMRILGFRRIYSFLAQRASPSFEHRQGEELFEGLGGGDMARSPLLRGVASGSVPGCVPSEPLTPVDSKGSRPSDLEAKAALVARVVRLAANHGPFRANCLKQSLVTWWFLRRNGMESTLRIGVRKEAALLEAHAWVECFGQPLNEGSDIHERFSPFDPTLLQEVNRI